MENNTTTHEFMTSRTKKVGYNEIKTFWTAHFVAIESGVELPESVKKDGWYKVLAPFITKVERWSCQSDMHLPEFPKARNWAELAKSQWPDRTYVVHTKFGTATIVLFQGCSAISGMTYKAGRKNKALTLGTWRKYGHKRGHGMQQLRAAFGMKLCTSPESGRDICEWEAVCRLTQPAYNEAAFAATTALYDAVKDAA